MERYSGNREPFLFLFCAGADEAAAEKLAALLGARAKLYAASALGKKERRALRKAAAVVPVLSARSLESVTAVLADEAAQDKPLIPVFLERVELPAGLRMLLGSTQGLRRFDYETEEAFERALGAVPALDALAVTPAQKRAGKRTLAAAAGLFAAAGLAALLLTLRPFSAERIDRDSTLGRLGLSGNPAAIKTVALYGDTLEKRFEDGGVYQAYASVANSSYAGIYLSEADATVKPGTLSDLSDFAGLTNLEELSLAGNAVEDVSPLFSLKKLKKLDLSMQLRYVQDPYRREVEAQQLDLTGISALENLETLYLCFNRWPDDGSVPAWMAELDGMPHFRTLVLDRSAEVIPALLGKVGYDLVLLGVEAGSYDELRAAAEDPDCRCIYVTRGAEIVIPEGEEWTLPANTMLNGVNLTIRVDGTLRVRGWFECGMTDVRNKGAVVVENGGSFIGGMSSTYNEGLFTVEAGGQHVLERGMEFWQQDGAYINRGTLVFGWGGQFHLQGGDVENDGVLIVEKNENSGMPMPDGWFENKRATAERFTGSGTVEIREAEAN